MTVIANLYIDRANEAFEAGFSSKSAKIEALQDVSRAYTTLACSIKDEILNRGIEQEELHSLYWNIPMYVHAWRAKHTHQVLNVLPEMAGVAKQIEMLVDLRISVKDADVVPAKRDTNKEEIERVSLSVRELMDRRKEQYNAALDLKEVFGGLPVTANVHVVVNQHGTRYIRAFYYLYNKLTPLSVIIAALQKK